MPKVSNVTETPANGAVFPLEGEIDLHVSPAIAISLQEIIARKPARLLVDLSRVSYVDSSGLAVLIDAMQKVQKYGGILRCRRDAGSGAIDLRNRATRSGVSHLSHGGSGRRGYLSHHRHRLLDISGDIILPGPFLNGRPCGRAPGRIGPKINRLT